jgi:hypothetical protein
MKDEIEENDINDFLSTYQKNFSSIFEKIWKKIEFLKSKHKELFKLFEFALLFQLERFYIIGNNIELLSLYISENTQTVLPNVFLAR